LPIISTAQALAVYVSKYISKGFEHCRPEDKGMRLGTYTSRFNRRHKLFGHLFSGRYKALIVDVASCLRKNE
jgi:hypothetical protein